MIPQSAIKKWSENFPWKHNYQIEQDLIICRALCALYNDEYLVEHLAFRSGTTLHKIYNSTTVSLFRGYRFGTN